MKAYTSKEAAYKAEEELLFGPGVHPSPIDNPPAQIMSWDCTKCHKKCDAFEEYLRHGCTAAPSPVMGAYRPKEVYGA